MRNFSENHNLLINQARTLGTYCHKHKFKGIEVMKGVKVSCITKLYGECGSNWLWRIIESIIPDFSKTDFRDFDPAVFLLDMQYNLQKDRSESAMRKVNGQFLENCIVCVKQRHGFFSPKRYKEIKMARELHEKLEANSLDFWNGISPVSK